MLILLLTWEWTRYACFNQMYTFIVENLKSLQKQCQQRLTKAAPCVMDKNRTKQNKANKQKSEQETVKREYEKESFHSLVTTQVVYN